MKDDLISRQLAINAIEKKAYRHTYLDQIIDIVSELPSAQPEPGEWVEDEQQFHVEKTYRCSKCGHPAWGYIEKTKYCPGCGAFMGGDPGC